MRWAGPWQKREATQKKHKMLPRRDGATSPGVRSRARRSPADDACWPWSPAARAASFARHLFGARGGARVVGAEDIHR